jgi:hypothetical protein
MASDTIFQHWCKDLQPFFDRVLGPCCVFPVSFFVTLLPLSDHPRVGFAGHGCKPRNGCTGGRRVKENARYDVEAVGAAAINWQTNLEKLENTALNIYMSLESGLEGPSVLVSQ